jgi:hypothetical protein
MQSNWIIESANLLLSCDPKRRIRVAQTGTAILATLPAVVVIQYATWAGFALSTAVGLWTLLTLGGCAVFFLASCSGCLLPAGDGGSHVWDGFAKAEKSTDRPGGQPSILSTWRLPLLT